MSRLGDAGVDLFLCDSTNSEIPGVGPSESEVGPTLHRLMRGADGQRELHHRSHFIDHQRGW
jgi:ribonuclease J